MAWRARYGPDTIEARFSLTCILSAHNVFNSSQEEPYTGRLDIDDYLMDLQLPHMIDLVEKYDAEIMVRPYCIYLEHVNSVIFTVV
jgi:alpha-L-fucosidase